MNLPDRYATCSLRLRSMWYTPCFCSHDDTALDTTTATMMQNTKVIPPVPSTMMTTSDMDDRKTPPSMAVAPMRAVKETRHQCNCQHESKNKRTVEPGLDVPRLRERLAEAQPEGAAAARAEEYARHEYPARHRRPVRRDHHEQVTPAADG